MAEQDAGPTGAAAWFPWGRQDLPGWRFDVITLLAVIGESSVAEHVQTLTASSFSLLPRIIPAPQALLRASRPQRLPEVRGHLSGVYSGIVLDTVGFFANIMHPLDEYKPFAFRVLEIEHATPLGQTPTTAAATNETEPKPKLGGGGASGTGENETANTKPSVQVDQSAADLERGPPPPSPSSEHLQQPPAPQRTSTTKMEQVLTMSKSTEIHAVVPATYSPVHILSVLSFLLTIAIIVAAIKWEDGTAILAICFISLAGTVVCYASYWRPILMERRTHNEVPPGDVVIRTREGAFILIRCTEEVARELYSGTEECAYVTQHHRVFMGLGMVLLMVAVVLLGNCGWNSQVLVGGSYIALNALYWGMSLVPQKHFWNMGRYKMRDATPEDALHADRTTDENDPLEGVASFTRTLWYAVRETKERAWVERSGALPGTVEWKKWLDEAVDEAQEAEKAGEEGERQKHRKWKAVERKNAIMKNAADKPAQRVAVDGIQGRETLGQGHSR